MVNHTHRVIVVGAGPHGLAMAAWLVDAVPSIIDDLVVIDPSGAFTTSWKAQFAAMGIDHLRSPSVHHPHPDPYALLHFADRQGRSDEFRHRYRLPDTALFNDFCDETVTEFDLHRCVVADAVTSVEASGKVHLASGAVLRGRHVVLAHNPRQPAIPTWAHHNDAVIHAADVDLRSHRIPPTVVIVGGGLSAAHLARGAVAGGADVTIIHRRPITTRDFDTHPGWLGPREMAGFSAIGDPHQRAQVATDARGGGSMPPWVQQQLRPPHTRGSLRMVCASVTAVSGGPEPVVTATEADGATLCVATNEVWLATGWSTDAATDPLVGPLAARGGSAPGLAAGLPVVDRHLRIPSTAVHVLGRLATLELGPTAGNVAGARHGAEAVAGAITACQPTTRH